MNSENVVKNFRDVGASINRLSGRTFLRENTIYRGGSLSPATHHQQIQNAASIINLRTGKDERKFRCAYFHFPADNRMENYDTSNRKIRKWINDVVKCVANGKTRFPVLLHCTSGKDRTGVVVAAILKACGIDDRFILQEYLLSEGEVDARWMKTALMGFGDIETYLNKVGGIDRLRARLRMRR